MSFAATELAIHASTATFSSARVVKEAGVTAATIDFAGEEAAPSRSLRAGADVAVPLLAWRAAQGVSCPASCVGVFVLLVVRGVVACPTSTASTRNCMPRKRNAKRAFEEFECTMLRTDFLVNAANGVKGWVS